MKKRTKIVMLPTANQKYQVNEGDIFINDSRQHSWGKLEALKCERVTSNGHAWNGSGIQTYINHLYFLSDERLKSEGWGMHSETHEVFQYEKDFYNPWVYRVIATTDPELKTEVTENTKKGGFHYGLLPQPSQAFIEEYCSMRHKRLARIRGIKLKRAFMRAVITYWILLIVSILTNPYI